MRTPSTFVCCYLLLNEKNKICLLLRKNTGFCDGMYGLISGHVEEGESAIEGMIREAKEEANLFVEPNQLKVVHVLHRKSNRLDIDIFFECTNWKGTIKNQEPEKCEALRFFPITELPPNIIPYIKNVIESISRREFYSEIGWK